MKKSDAFNLNGNDLWSSYCSAQGLLVWYMCVCVCVYLMALIQCSIVVSLIRTARAQFEVALLPEYTITINGFPMSLCCVNYISDDYTAQRSQQFCPFLYINMEVFLCDCTVESKRNVLIPL